MKIMDTRPLLSHSLVHFDRLHRCFLLTVIDSWLILGPWHDSWNVCAGTRYESFRDTPPEITIRSKYLLFQFQISQINWTSSPSRYLSQHTLPVTSNKKYSCSILESSFLSNVQLPLFQSKVRAKTFLFLL